MTGQTLIAAARTRRVTVFGGLGFLAAYLVIRLPVATFWADALDYWAVNPANPYAGNLFESRTFAYSPPLALGFVALGHLPDAIFVAAWTIGQVLVLAWLLRPWPWAGVILAGPILEALVSGQIELFLAAAIVLGFRRPSLWALPILTKSTMGIGIVWFVVRREWRHAAIALATTGVLAAISYLVEPQWWAEWLAFLQRTGVDVRGLPIRLLGGVLTVAWAARTRRPWAVVTGIVLAAPVIYLHTLAMLVGASSLYHQPGIVAERGAMPVPAEWWHGRYKPIAA